MKKALLFLTMASIYGCMCMGQLPTQYIYVDENCNAALPDYSGMVVIADNCSIVTLTQLPMPGTVISTTTTVQLRATDSSGNASWIDFETVILDTIAPTIQFDPEWVGYTDKEVMDMYKVYYGWVQDLGDYWNENVAGIERTFVFPDSTTLTFIEDSMYYFHGTIPILEYRADEGYWTDRDPDIMAIFR